MPIQEVELCSYCGFSGTSSHYLLECPGLTHARERLSRTISGDISVSNCTLTASNITAMLVFLRNTGLGFADTIKFDARDDSSDNESIMSSLSSDINIGTS